MKKLLLLLLIILVFPNVVYAQENSQANFEYVTIVNDDVYYVETQNIVFSTDMLFFWTLIEDTKEKSSVVSQIAVNITKKTYRFENVVFYDAQGVMKKSVTNPSQWHEIQPGSPMALSIGVIIKSEKFKAAL